MIYLGIDPDTNATGVCRLTTVSPGVDRVELWSVVGVGVDLQDRLKGMAKAMRLDGSCAYDEMAVEWQALRPGREKNPNAMMAVMAVAGMALAAHVPVDLNFRDKVHLPIPSEWKGTVPKEVDQERTLRDAKLSLDSPEFEHVPRKFRTHCVDALGLCLWLKRGRILRSRA